MPGKHYDLDTDVTLSGNDDKVIASQKATKTYVDTEVDKKADPTIIKDSESEVQVKELVINKLTNEEYDVVTKENNQLYLTPDTTDQDIANAIDEHNTNNAAHSNKVDKVSSTDNAIVKFDGTSGSIQNTGIIIEDNNDLKIGRYTYNVLHAATSMDPGPRETVIHTKIKYASMSYMPIIRIYGYAYGLASPIELKLGFYIYDNKMGYCGAVSMGAWRPEIFIFKETIDEIDYIAVGFRGQCYFLGFDVDVQFPTNSYNTNYISTVGWSASFNNSSETNIIPTDGMTDAQLNANNDVCRKVPYKSTLETLTINGTNYNGTSAVSINTPDTKNTAGSTDSSSKLFLIGATSQAANPQTYSHDTVFVDTNGRLNSAAPASNANDTTVATTKWVKDQDYAKNTDIPTVNDATITIQKNSTTVDSFTLNQNTDKTINITVPTKTSDITNDSGFLTSHQSIKTLKTDNTTTQTASSSESIAGSGTINLHKISKTGSYNDLLNKPTIPTVNNKTITIQKNSTTVDSFTLNQSTDKTINITVPTKTSDITNDSGFLTEEVDTLGTVLNRGNSATTDINMNSKDWFNAGVKLTSYYYSTSQTPNTQYYWYKLEPPTSGSKADRYFISIDSDVNYPRNRATFLLDISKYSSNSYNISLNCLAMTGSKTTHVLNVAIDADGYVYVQSDAVWSSYMRFVRYGTESSTISYTQVGLAAFGTAAGFTPVKIITDTGCIRLVNGAESGTYYTVLPSHYFRGDLVGNADTATKATKDGDDNTISSTYLKLSGGTMTGGLKFGTSAIPQETDPTYMLSMDAFASGGAVKWVSVANIKAGKDGDGNTISSTYVKTANLPTKLSDFTDDLGSSPVHTHSQYQPSGNYISYTNNTATVAGTSKTVSKTNPETLYVSDGLIMGGTAQEAGLVTRGICGVASPSATGAATKDNLFINYDGDNTYRSSRQLVLQAGTVGTHYGNNLYQYAAARGDAVKNYADATYAAKATSLSGYGITDAYTKTEVDGMISSVYKPAGSVAFASLPTLASGVLGNVYNVTDAFTTTANFVEGAGKSYPAGTNVVVVNTGTTASPTYKFDVLAGFVDLSGYVPTSRKVNGKALSADITISKSDVGLGNIDNTSDSDKPISTATQNALDGKENTISDLNKIRSGANSFYVKGTQTASTPSFTGVLSAVDELYEGLTIDYWLPFAGTTAGDTLNLTLADGSTTGPINCYYQGTTRLTTHLSANNVGRFIYQTVTISGNSYTGWWLLRAYYTEGSNTYDREYDNYYRAYAGSALAAYGIVMKGVNGRLYPLTTPSYNTSAIKTVTTVGLRPDLIWLYSGNAACNAGAVIKAQSLYRSMPSTAGTYYFNAAVPTYCDIYLCGNYDENTGLFYLATTDSSGTASVTDFYKYVPYNTEPNYQDYFITGRYYIFLGSSYSTANYFHLMDQHPMYYFDGTNLINAADKPKYAATFVDWSE